MNGTMVTHVALRGGVLVHVLGNKENVKDKVRSAWGNGDVMVDLEVQFEGSVFNTLTVLLWSIDMIMDDHELGVEGTPLSSKDTGFVIDAEKVGEVVL